MNQFNVTVAITGSRMETKRIVELTIILYMNVNALDTIGECLVQHHNLKEYETWTITSLINTMISEIPSSSLNSSCLACKFGEMNQEGHMEYGGCLYDGSIFE